MELLNQYLGLRGTSPLKMGSLPRGCGVFCHQIKRIDGGLDTLAGSRRRSAYWIRKNEPQNTESGIPLVLDDTGPAAQQVSVFQNLMNDIGQGGSVVETIYAVTVRQRGEGRGARWKTQERAKA
ncbi:hypothetical protein N7532_004414 [Penicillium argentinense]|uniref:Uncharacterized protein n=1 Tax=Penicillium argentinense TaxID=1131581 RepID=A0A9W9FPC9_9EURO|nr:uncharacterized protein N7532_004414 [Penicillium argentinense]KAJ5103885.1 hypothetical protein N7532_004414 [Penicillium argentinense]